MIFISFYTSHDKYIQLSKKWQQSLNNFRLVHDLTQFTYDTFPSAVHACLYKAQFILDKLLQHRQAVCFLDIDTEVKKYPNILFSDYYDFACYNWCYDLNHHLENIIPFNHNLLKCSGGVLKFGYTAPAIELLLRWIHWSNENPELGSDCCLDKAFLLNYNSALKPLWLPKEYNCMTPFGTFWNTVDPVILHEHVIKAEQDREIKTIPHTNKD